MYRKCCLTIMILAFVGANGQVSNETEGLYLEALEQYAIGLDSFYARTYPRENVIYLQETELLDSIPLIINKHKVVLVTSKNSKNLFRNNGNKLTLVRVFPMQLEGNQIKIHLVPYQSELKRRNKLFYRLSGWTNVFFEFNCESQRWEYLKTTRGGI